MALAANNEMVMIYSEQSDEEEDGGGVIITEQLSVPGSTASTTPLETISRRAILSFPHLPPNDTSEGSCGPRDKPFKRRRVHRATWKSASYYLNEQHEEMDEREKMKTGCLSGIFQWFKHRVVKERCVERAMCGAEGANTSLSSTCKTASPLSATSPMSSNNVEEAKRGVKDKLEKTTTDLKMAIQNYESLMINTRGHVNLYFDQSSAWCKREAAHKAAVTATESQLKICALQPANPIAHAVLEEKKVVEAKCAKRLREAETSTIKSARTHIRYFETLITEYKNLEVKYHDNREAGRQHDLWMKKN